MTKWPNFFCSLIVIAGTVFGLYEAENGDYQTAVYAWLIAGLAGWMTLASVDWPLAARVVAVGIAVFAFKQIIVDDDWQRALLYVGASNAIVFFYNIRRSLKLTRN